jgi:hypothetical protein
MAVPKFKFRSSYDLEGDMLPWIQTNSSCGTVVNLFFDPGGSGQWFLFYMEP